MDNKQALKEKDIRTKLFWAMGLATLAILMTLFRIPFKFWVALIAYIVMAIAVVKKDGAFGILQVILVFPAIYVAIKEMFDSNSSHMDDETGDEKTSKLERMANFTMFYTAVTILVTILLPIVRFIWNLFA